MSLSLSDVSIEHESFESPCPLEPEIASAKALALELASTILD